MSPVGACCASCAGWQIHSPPCLEHSCFLQTVCLKGGQLRFLSGIHHRDMTVVISICPISGIQRHTFERPASSSCVKQR
eukprot:360329-Chlamydomonas_euryale.AAC.10